MILALDEFDALVDNEGSESVYKLTRIQEMRAWQGSADVFAFYS